MKPERPPVNGEGTRVISGNAAILRGLRAVWPNEDDGRVSEQFERTTVRRAASTEVCLA